MPTETSCQGNRSIDAHNMAEVGRCSHPVAGAKHGYIALGCQDCGVTAHRGPISFTCGPRLKWAPLTAENCAALRWKSEREGMQS